MRETKCEREYERHESAKFSLGLFSGVLPLGLYLSLC